MRMNYDGKASCLGAFLAMVGGIELVCRRCPVLERRARINNRSWARISSLLALRSRILPVSYILTICYHTHHIDR